MKRCPRCQEHKPYKEYYRNSQAVDGCQTYCKLCAVKIRIAHYRTPQGKARKQLAQAKYRARNHRFLMEYLATHPCIDCGEADVVVLEFDHRDDVTKINHVSHMIGSASIGKIAAEIAKCDVRCANCHRRRTAIQLGYYKYFIQAA